MPSTFSPALRLELIGNGEQAANWGNTTNTNLGTLLEQAVTGVGNITMADANYTLVSGNGISDEARNAVLVISSTTLTATRNVIVPTSNKFYAVRNATTGGQSILVKTSSGTGVTLANGFTQLMYCDGTNVVLASLPINASTGAVVLNSATLNNPTINGFTGDTAVINVGSGQLYKDVSGLVGIGISSPVSKLHVYAASGLNEARVTSGSNNTALGVDGSNAYLGTYQAIPILFQTNSVERMRIASSGAVSVTGAVSIGGSLAVTGLLTLSSALGVASGGTGITTVPSNGQIPIGNGTGYSAATLTAGSNISITNSAGGVTIAATNVGTGSVTSVGVSGGTTGLTTSGSPITTSGTITLAGTLALANGGTGATSAAAARTSLGSTTVGDAVFIAASTAAARTATGSAASGAVGSSDLTMNTSRLLGRTTASAGAVEEISVGTGLSLSAGIISNSGGTVTSITAGSGLTGGTITGSGTFALDVYTGSTANNTSFPIGTVLMVDTSNLISSNNQSATIYVENNVGALGYRVSTSGMSSPVALSGTWRFRGGYIVAGCPSNTLTFANFQRVS